MGTKLGSNVVCPQNFASIASAVTERRRECRGYRGDRWATSRQPSARRSGRTGTRIRLKIVRPFGTGRPHMPTKSEVNRPCHFNLASIKGSSTRPRLIKPIHIFGGRLYRTPFRNGTLDFHQIWHECRRGYATHFHQISSKSN